MSWFTDFYRSAVGKKAVMAVTGIILFGFVLVHMIGNLQAVRGRRGTLNEYGEFLRQVGAPALPPNGAALDRPAGAARRGRAAHLGRVAGHADEPGGAPVALRAPAEDPHQLRLAHHALGRGDHPAVRHLPPPPLHHGHGPPDVRGRRRSTTTWWPASASGGCRCSTSWRRSRWGSTSTTGCGACSSRWGGTIRGSTPGASGFAHAFAWIVTLGNISFPIAVLTGLVR